jgi:hypothetical protein
MLAMLQRHEWTQAFLAGRVPVVSSRVFGDSGVLVKRTRNSHLVYVVGPQHSIPYSAGHLHADHGSFELEVGGQPVLIDSGTYLYNRDDVLRDHFRSAAAHNGLRVDGREPMTPHGTFGWEEVAASRLLSSVDTDDMYLVASEHVLPSREGYCAWRRALVQCDANMWLLVDTLTGPVDSQPHTFEAFFHFSDCCGKPAAGGGGEFTLPSTGASLVFGHAVQAETYKLDLMSQSELPSKYSPLYGSLRDGWTLRGTGSFAGSCVVVHWLSEHATRRPVVVGRNVRIETASGPRFLHTDTMTLEDAAD